MTAMKFSGAHNERIYCKEYLRVEGRTLKKVVMILAYEKKEMDKKTRKLIETLGGYEYEL